MALRPPSIEEPAPPWRISRAAAAGFVGALHVALIGLVLWAQPGAIPTAPLPHESFLLFPPPPPARLPVKIETPAVHRARPLFRYEPSTAITLPAPVENAIELSLFKCKPENLANLTPEERLRCGAGLEMSSFRPPLPGDVHSLALDPGRWSAAIAARAAQAPCSYTGRVIVNATTGETRPYAGIDSLCAMGHVLGGEEP